MSISGDIRAGKAFVELYVKDGKLKNGLLAAQRTVRAFGAVLTRVGQGMFVAGTAILAPLLASAKAATTMGAQVSAMSARTHVGVEALSQLAYAASQSSVELTTLEAGLLRLQKVVADAAAGNENAVEVFRSLGLTIGEIRKLSPDRLFLLVIEQLQKIADPAAKATAEIGLFGKSVADLRPLLDAGAEGVKDLMRRAVELGLVMSHDTVKAAERMQNAIETITAVLKMSVFHIGSGLIPELTALTNRVTDLLVKANAWLEQNRELFLTIAKLAAVVTAAGLALLILGKITEAVHHIHMALEAGIFAAKLAFGVLTAAVTTTTAAMTFMAAHPLLIVAGLVAIGAAAYVFAGDLKNAFFAAGRLFAAFKKDAIQSFRLIRAAISVGDFTLAMQAVWQSLRIAWAKGIAYLKERWQDFKLSYLTLSAEMFARVREIWLNAKTNLQIVWIDLLYYLTVGWSKFVNFLRRTWEQAVGLARKLATYARAAWEVVAKPLSYEEIMEARDKELEAIEKETKGKLKDADRDNLHEEMRAEDARMHRDAVRENEYFKEFNDIFDQMADSIEFFEDQHKQALAEIGEDVIAIEKERLDFLRQAYSKLWFNALFPKLRAAGQKAGEQGGGDVLDGILARASSQGTFNAAAARMLHGTDNFQERIARATERTAKAVENFKPVRNPPAG